MPCLAQWLLLLKILQQAIPTVAHWSALATAFQRMRPQVSNETRLCTWTFAEGPCSSFAGITTQKHWSTHTPTGARSLTNSGRSSSPNGIPTQRTSWNMFLLRWTKIRRPSSGRNSPSSRTDCRWTHTGTTSDGYFRQGTNMLPPESISFNVCVGSPTRPFWQNSNMLAERATWPASSTTWLKHSGIIRLYSSSCRSYLRTALPLCKGGTRTTASASVCFEEFHRLPRWRPMMMYLELRCRSRRQSRTHLNCMVRDRNHRRWRFRYPPTRRSRRSSRRARRNGATSRLRAVLTSRLLRTRLQAVLSSMRAMTAGAAHRRATIILGRSGPKSGASADLACRELCVQRAGDARVGDLTGRKSPEALCSCPLFCKPANLFDRSLNWASSQGKRPHPRHFKLESSCNILLSFAQHRMILFMLGVFLQPSLIAAAPMHTSGAPIPDTPNPARQRIAKRSYLRALRRLQTTGFARYRGRPLQATTAELNMAQQPRLQKPRQPDKHPTTTASPQPQRSSFRMVSWNCGGLSSLAFESLKDWLGTPATPTILCLQETHWRQTSEFRSGGWSCFSSSDGSSTSGVMTMIYLSPKLRHVALQYCELIPGRVLHVRICTEPPTDVLNVYQHSWNPSKQEYINRGEEPVALLLQDRARVWDTFRSWVHSVPRRNRLVAAGDFNAELKAHHPNIGLGLTPHRTSAHRDQSQFQAIVTHSNLVAANTWSRAGAPSATYVNHQDAPAQIDYVFLRLPCNVPALRTRILRAAPVVALSGMRHFPITLEVPTPSIPKSPPGSKSPTAAAAIRLVQSEEDRLRFEQVAQTLLQDPEIKAEHIDSCLLQAYVACNQPPRAGPTPRRAYNLQEYWQLKRQCRTSKLALQTRLESSSWSTHLITDSAASSAERNLSATLAAWSSLAKYLRYSRELNRRIRAGKREQVDEVLKQAQEVDGKGLSHLYKVMQKLAPKQPRRSIHLRTKQEGLLSPQQSLTAITTYFSQVFNTPQNFLNQDFHITQPLSISREEISSALQSLPRSKALPRGQAPSVLWKTCHNSITEVLCRDFAELFAPGKLWMPTAWHRAFIALLPKPNKSPQDPASLRPISLLPAVSKILARIAAQRVRPHLEEALKSQPQFAYVCARQTQDAIDRVASHCHSARQRLAALRPNHHSRSHAPSQHLLHGAVQVSLDLSKAFDCLPRHLLASALRRIHVPENLVQFILFVHHNVLLVFTKDEYTAELRTGTGIRQGCGLAPLLWASFTLLVLDKLQTYMRKDQLTFYSDDMHMAWDINSALDFRNAGVQIGRILTDLRNFGMTVSIDKSVVLLSLKGPHYKRACSAWIRQLAKGRFFCVNTAHGEQLLPIKQDHLYLGVKIGYRQFERNTIAYRIQQSWATFHRLYRVLTSNALSLQVRLRVWRTCVRPVLLYGLTSMHIDAYSANKLRRHTVKQLRSLSRSPAHITHESNEALLTRLQESDIVEHIGQVGESRLHLASTAVGELQPSRVHQYWKHLTDGFSAPAAASQSAMAGLTEVTGMLRRATACPICGLYYPSLHAVRTHIGKSHPEASTAYTKDSYATKSHRTDKHMMHALQGKPQCRHCLKTFSTWRAFMGHHHQRACPVLYGDKKAPAPVADQTSSAPAERVSAPGGIEPLRFASRANFSDDTPLASRNTVQKAILQRNLPELTSLIAPTILAGHCPFCHHCSQSHKYITRHACLNHPFVKSAESLIREWAQGREGVGRPCKWCKQNYKQPAQMHRKSCVVLWACGHLLHRHSKLADPGQQRLPDGPCADRGAPPSSGRTEAVRGLHAPGTLHQRAIGECFRGGPRAKGVNGHQQPGQKSYPGSSGGRPGDEAEVPEGLWEGQPGASAASAVLTGPQQPQGVGSEHCGQGGGQALTPLRLACPSRTGAATEPATPGPQLVEQGPELPERKRDSGATPSGSGPHPTGPSPVGLHILHEAGLGIHALLEDIDEAQAGGWQPHTGVGGSGSALPSCASLEQEEAGGPGHLGGSPQEHPDALPPHDLGGKARGCHRESSPYGQASLSGPGGSQRPGLPALEPNHQVTREGHPGAPPRGSRFGGPEACHPAPAVPSSSAPLPCPPTPDTGDAGGGGSFYVGTSQSQSGGSVDLPAVRAHEPQRAVALGRRHHEDGTPRTEPSGAVRRGVCASTGLNPVPALQAVFLNPGNHCYAHAVLLALKWFSEQAFAPLEPPALSIRSSLHMVFRGSPGSCLSRLSCWTEVLPQWSSESQQDAAEFLHRSGHCLVQPDFIGEWETRLPPNSPGLPSQVTDSGQTLPMLLSAALPSAAPCTLQSLVDQWHRRRWRLQEARHALIGSTPLLVLQIARFDDRGRKVRNSILPPYEVSIPSFSGVDCSVHLIPYEVVSIVFHVGLHTRSGHYRAALLSAGVLTHTTDDGRAAKSITVAEASLALRNSYMFVLRRLQ